MQTNIEKFNTLPLRVKKNAKTKIEILNVCMKQLLERRLDKIKVDEICQELEISQKTFFNHFEKKEKIITYFIQLHSYEMGYVSSKFLSKTQKPLEAILEIYSQTAQGLSRCPNIMLELIDLQTRVEISCQFDVSDAEKLYYFQDIMEIETFESGGLDYLIVKLLNEAKVLTHLKDDTDVNFLYLSIMSLFYGSSILILKLDPKNYASTLHVMIENCIQPHLKEKND